MKKLLVFLIAVLLAVGFSACGGSSYSSPTAPATSPGMTPTPNRGY